MKSSRLQFTLGLAVACAAIIVCLPLCLQAQTFTSLYSFCSVGNCTDGANPGGVIADTAGNLYGATIYGGASSPNWVGGGVVFKLTPAGDESVLYTFHNGVALDGYWPYGSIAIDAQGNLYGTTERGGAHSIHVPHGDGIAFKVSPDGKETILHSFGAFNSDGVEPFGGMVLDAKGNIYGTTYIGGVYAAGTLFKLTASGVETVLHSFTDNGDDGSGPQASLTMDSHGNLYGTTLGFSSPGTVFELTAGGSYQILHQFTGLGDGFAPLGSLTLDSQGNLYGTTYRGGNDVYPGAGTVFKLTSSSNGTWQETILYNFIQQTPNCQNPDGNVVFDTHGNLYGTTGYGGAFGGGCLFKISPAGKFTIVHNFGEGTDGASPTGNLVFSQGNLYGTTAAGGVNSQGTVFKITP